MNLLIPALGRRKNKNIFSIFNFTLSFSIFNFQFLVFAIFPPKPHLSPFLSRLAKSLKTSYLQYYDFELT